MTFSAEAVKRSTVHSGESVGKYTPQSSLRAPHLCGSNFTSLNLKFDLQGYHKQTKGGKGGKSFGIIWDYLADSGIPLSSHTRVTSSKSCQPSWRWREVREEGDGQGVDGTFLVLWGLINYHFFNLLSIMNTLTVEVISGNKRLTLSNEIVLK